MSRWFFSSTVTVTAVLSIRWCVGNRVSHRVRYSLWLLALLRLLIPVNFGESALSVDRLVPEVQAFSVQQEPVLLPLETTVSRELPNHAADHGSIGMMLWIAGTGTVLLCLLVSGLRLQRRLRRDRTRLKEACCPVPVYVTASLAAPCQIGLFRPVIYVTEEAAAEGMLDHVLAHEMTHLLHFDHLWSALRCAALALHWFNPLVWLAVWLSKEDAELACDEGALERLGREERFAYGGTLIHLSRKNKGGMMMGANTMLGRRCALRRRVEAIACGKRTCRSAAILTALLCMMTAGCTFTDAPETTLTPQSIQIQPESTEPQVQGPQPGYDVWERVTENILTEQEEEFLNRIPGFDSGEDWSEGFRQTIKNNLYLWRARYGAENAGIVSVEEIFDERAAPGVHIYEIRSFLGDPRQERSDYLIMSEDGCVYSSDLDSCFISDVFGADA